MVFWGCFSRPMVTGVSRDWMVWCFRDTSVDTLSQVFQGTRWYGLVFRGCFSGPMVSGVSRDWVVWYGVLGILQWTGGLRCFKGLGGMV